MAITSLTTQDFDQKIAQYTQPVIVDFWADWCVPCKMFAPILEEIDAKGGYQVCKVNIDEHPDLAVRFGVMNIPTLIFFKNGVQSGKLVGVHDMDTVLNAVNA